MSDAEQPPALPAGGLTRELLMSGQLAEFLRRTMPEMRLTTDEERAASLRAILDQRPEHGDGVWVFAYGSLIWNPAMLVSGHRIATATGWHRAFCLSVKSGRGTPENPGVMLGLRPGGTCPGMVLRIAEADVEHELTLLWRREMVADGYIPVWVPVADETGREFGAAIAFTINPEVPSYCGGLPEAEIVRRLATASGRLGTGAEYLFRTHEGLAAHGVTDPFLDRLVTLVTKALDEAA